jgi:hypothetical protein
MKRIGMKLEIIAKGEGTLCDKHGQDKDEVDKYNEEKDD